MEATGRRPQEVKSAEREENEEECTHIFLNVDLYRYAKLNSGITFENIMKAHLLLHLLVPHRSQGKQARHRNTLLSHLSWVFPPSNVTQHFPCETQLKNHYFAIMLV